ncbi:MAG: energy transducer TonB [Hyphomonadaceae bacterium]
MTGLKTVRGLTIAMLAAGVFMTPALLAHADPQTPVATEATTDPSLRPDTPMPAYPKQSRAKKEAGVVRVKLCVEADGRVTKADIAQTSGFPNLDNAVLKWVQGVRFNAAMKGATPVAVCDFPLKYEFQVTKGPTRQEQTTNPFDIGPATGLATGP